MFKKLLRGHDLFIDGITGVTIGGITLLIAADVAGRYIFNNPIRGAGEVALIGMIWIVFLGSVSVMREDAHISLEVVTDQLHGRTRSAVAILKNVLVLGISITVLVIGIDYVVTSHFTKLLITELSRRYLAISVLILLSYSVLYSIRNIVREVRQWGSDRNGDAPNISATEQK